MTENDPTAHDPAAPRHPETGQQAAQGGWPGSSYGEQAQPESGGAPQYSEPSYHAVTGADPSYGAQHANPWSAQGAQMPSGQNPQSVYPPPNPYGQPSTAVYNAAPPQPKAPVPDPKTGEPTNGKKLGNSKTAP